MLTDRLYRRYKRRRQRRIDDKGNYPNTHMPASEGVLETLPDEISKAFVRPSYSDRARVEEFVKSIYVTDCYLHERLKAGKPRTIVDVGANIGLSALSLLNEFPTVCHVIGIEAEAENAAMLKRNFDLWQSMFENVRFEAIHAIATGEKGRSFAMSRLGEDNATTTASGTFRFTPIADQAGTSRDPAVESVTLHDLMASLDGPIICKMDIEGGEQFIFDADSSWLAKVEFFTAEVHDRFGPEFINSSAGMIRALGDFAIVPQRDVLHCYRR